MEKETYYLDLSDQGNWLIKSTYGDRFVSGIGTDKQKVINLIERLNKAHRPSVEQRGLSEIWICWNEHKREEDCDFKREI
jgi:hypothetical protein